MIAALLLWQQKEVDALEFIISFCMSVAASVVAYYICKWLDEQLGGK